MGNFIPLAVKYEKRVIRRGGCWGWTSSISNKGYAMISHVGKMLNAHRVSWELHNGPIPTGMQVLHRCDNPPCTNPAHLFLGTASENIRDCWAKGRHKWNTGGNGKAGVRGVFAYGNRWQARIYRPKSVYVGIFNSIEEARIAVEKARAATGSP
jgi:hypothetical protein